MFCKKGHKDIAKQPSVKTSQQKRLEKQVQLCKLCILLYHFFTLRLIPTNIIIISYPIFQLIIVCLGILTLIKLNIYICLFEKFQLFHYCHTANLNQATLTPYYSLIINLPVFHFLIPVSFILEQAEKEGKSGLNGSVVHII